MSIEHNEEKMRDVEIPLFELGQRIELLEGNFTSF